MKFAKSLLPFVASGLLAGLVSGGLVPRADMEAVMDEGPETAKIGENIFTIGLDSCISMSAIGIVTGDRNRDKAMAHISATGQANNDAVRTFLHEVKSLKLDEVRITISYPGPDWVEEVIAVDEDFNISLGGSGSQAARLMQDLVNSLAEEAWDAAKEFTDEHGGRTRSFMRVGKNRFDSHQLWADWGEYVQGVEVQG